MIDDATRAELREAHRGFERAREHVWLERVRVGLEYRRAMRDVDESVRQMRVARDDRVRRAVAAGASYREVARALGVSHSRVQQIVNDRKAGPSRRRGESP